MTIEVTAPDGSVVEFPDGTSPGVIRGAMHAHAGAHAAGSHGAVDTAVDMGRGFWGGTLTGLQGMQQFINPVAIAGEGIKTLAPMLPHSAQGAATAAGRFLTGETATNALGGNYQTHTTPGRYAHAVGLAALNAVAPEGIPAKVAATVVPGVLGQAGQDLAAHFHAPAIVQQGAGVLGGVLGGGIANAKGILDNVGAAQANAIPKATIPVANAVSAALKIGNTDPAVLRASLASGVLPVAADPGLTQLGEAVATVPGEGQIALRAAAAARKGTQTDRAMTAMQTHLGVDPTAARGGVDAVVANGQAAAEPLYRAIRANPAPVWSPELAALAQRPAIKKAIGLVSNNMLNSGQDPTTAGIAIDPDTGAATIGSDLGNVVENQPTAATWVGVHQALGKTVERSPLTNQVIPNSMSPGNFDISVASRDLRNALAGDGGAEAAPGVASGPPAAAGQTTGNAFGQSTGPADQSAANAAGPADAPQGTGVGQGVSGGPASAPRIGAIPGYGDALATSGDYLSTQNAFDRARGQLFHGPVYDFSKMWSSLGTPPEQAAGQAALANDVLEASDRGRFEPGLFKSPGVQAKLAIAFGDDPASNFTDQMEADGAERDAYGHILDNSRTASRQALISQYQADNQPGGFPGLMKSGVGALKWGSAAMTAPHMLPVMMADKVVNSAGAKAAALPWTDPGVNAQLGGVLADPQAFTSLLDQLDQAAAGPTAAAAWRGGVLGIPQVAAPGIIGGVLAGPAPQQGQ
jgi:hypothetical protein